jgi:hypothetical protein
MTFLVQSWPLSHSNSQRSWRNALIADVQQELRTPLEHLRSSPVFSGVRVLVFCAILCRSLFVFLSYFIWPLYSVFFVDWLIRIAPTVSFGHCIVCSSSIYWFWLPLWYLLAIVLSVPPRFIDSDCLFGIFWPLYCLFFVDYQRGNKKRKSKIPKG